MKFGGYELSLHLFGTLRLDGGAMFGSMPKNLWNRRLQADEENCIPLATRSLLIQTNDRKILVDVGCGDKWDEKYRTIYGIKNTPLDQIGFEPSDITDIILTHLHFDHAGGISRQVGSEPDAVALTYPDAEVYLQQANWDTACAPLVRERASYLAENVSILNTAKLNLIDGSEELFPNVWVHRIDGHTAGQQWIEIRDGSQSVAFVTDLIPTQHHLFEAVTMGYDLCSKTVMREKESLLSTAADQNWILVFQHDPTLPAARIKRDERGRYVVAEEVAF